MIRGVSTIAGSIVFMAVNEMIGFHVCLGGIVLERLDEDELVRVVDARDHSNQRLPGS